MTVDASSRCTRRAALRASGAAVKIVFGVKDVRAFVADTANDGLKFGPIHEAGELLFANVKDPAGNSLQISNRGM